MVIGESDTYAVGGCASSPMAGADCASVRGESSNRRHGAAEWESVMTDYVVWCAPCGSFGGCDRDDILVVSETDLTDADRAAIGESLVNEPLIGNAVYAILSARIEAMYMRDNPLEVAAGESC